MGSGELAFLLRGDRGKADADDQMIGPGFAGSISAGGFDVVVFGVFRMKS